MADLLALQGLGFRVWGLGFKRSFGFRLQGWGCGSDDFDIEVALRLRVRDPVLGWIFEADEG